MSEPKSEAELLAITEAQLDSLYSNAVTFGEAMRVVNSMVLSIALKAFCGHRGAAADLIAKTSKCLAADAKQMKSQGGIAAPNAPHLGVRH